MASSPFPSAQYFSENLIESAGAVLFRLSTKEICINHIFKKDVYVLAKGMRNLGESRQTAAVREVLEETGYTCKLLPLNMAVRCPPAIETQAIHGPQFYKGIVEPFTLQTRKLSDQTMKVIWWYVGAVEENVARIEVQEYESSRFTASFVSYDEALEKLTYQMDRDMVKKAIELVESTYSS